MGAWKVIVNGKDSGIVETNYAYALQYWSYRAKVTGKKIKLKRVDKK
jgi:hypothetical protein